MSYHIPALLEEAVNGLAIKPDGVYVDATFGGGGHSRVILQHLDKGKLLAFDQDEDAATNALGDERFILIKHNFRYLKKHLRLHGIIPINGLLADLGVSSHQFDTPKRGFSIRHESDELDMRMSTDTDGLTAKQVINTYSEEELRKLFSEYGEIPNARKLVGTILREREKSVINTVGDLINIAKSCVVRGKENQYYAKLFQALRIEVNNELDALKELLLQGSEVIKKGGRLVVISYHSLEDRLVKNFMNKGKFEGEPEKDIYGNLLSTPFRPLNKKPITPSAGEIDNNPRVRSAKLRIAERI